jgi:hypothetical protein
MKDDAAFGQIHQSPPTTVLTPHQQDKIKSLWDECVQYWRAFKTLEQFELEFYRDRHPDAEIGVWTWITDQFKARKDSVADKGKLIDDLALESVKRFPPLAKPLPPGGINDDQHRSGGL